MDSGGADIGVIVVVFLALAILCGMISASIAGRKGLSTGGYFLLGFFFGVIGIIVAAVVTPPNAYGAYAPRMPYSPPGWHPDPWGVARVRWWDGYQWTSHTG